MKRRPETPGKRRAERLAAKLTVSPYFRGNRIKFRVALMGKAKRKRIGGDPGRATKPDETVEHRRTKRRMRAASVRAQRLGRKLKRLKRQRRRRRKA